MKHQRTCFSCTVQRVILLTSFPFCDHASKRQVLSSHLGCISPHYPAIGNDEVFPEQCGTLAIILSSFQSPIHEMK